MTDRYNGFIVVLEEDIRSDDAEGIIDAIKHLRGVLTVVPNVATSGSAIAGERVKDRVRVKLYDLLGDL